MTIDAYHARDVRVVRPWGAQGKGAVISLPPRRRAQLLKLGMVEEIAPSKRRGRPPKVRDAV